MRSQTTAAEEIRDVLRGAHRIAFPPALGEPDLVGDLADLLGDAVTEVVVPARTRGTSLDFGPNVRVRALFGGRAVDGGDYVPLQYRLWSELIAPGGPLAVDVALVRLGPADARGRHTVGPSASITSDLVRAARVVIAEIDPQLPKTCGDSASVPARAITYAVEAKGPLDLVADPSTNGPTDADRVLAHNLAALVADGSHIEIGIGSAGETIVPGLREHRDLRVHAGALSSGVQALLTSDAVDPAWRTPVAEAIGPASLMHYIERNERLNFQSTRILHDPRRLGAFDGLVTVNGALAVDLLGRASCEGDVRAPVGGIGGLVDFLIAGRVAQGGRNILVLHSRSRNGRTRIVDMLPSGEVSVPRYLIDHVVTEWGSADLRIGGRRECAEQLIGIAHPDDRAELTDRLRSLLPNG